MPDCHCFETDVWSLEGSFLSFSFKKHHIKFQTFNVFIFLWRTFNSQKKERASQQFLGPFPQKNLVKKNVSLFAL